VDVLDPKVGNKFKCGDFSGIVTAELDKYGYVGVELRDGLGGVIKGQMSMSTFMAMVVAEAEEKEN
jgi:hypothetical protein